MNARSYFYVILGWLIAIYSQFSLGAEINQNINLQWFGQSAIKIKTPQGKVILIDPFISMNPSTPSQFKNLSNIGKVDLILVTHGHFDHLGDTPTLLKQCQCKLIAPSGLEDNLANLKMVESSQLIHMNKTGSYVPFEGVKITMVHAEHSSEFDWLDPDTHQHHVLYGGEPVGFIISVNDKFTIYHMGDTGLFSDMALIGEYYHPDLILIPIGGNFTMGPKEAAFATNHWLKPKYALPFHYGTFPVLKGTPQEYEISLTRNTTEVIHIQPGDSKNFNF